MRSRSSCPKTPTAGHNAISGPGDAARPGPARSNPYRSASLWLWLFVLGVSAVLLFSLAIPLSPGRPSLATVLYDRNGKLLTTLAAENREPIPLGEVPVFLRQAVIATEDAEFYRHNGISLRGIARAFMRDLTRGRYAEGGSTITQQLARALYLNQRRTIWRKLLEVYYAFRMELHLSKDTILERYLNQVYFGEGAYGVKAAAATYFGREPRELNEAEQALLAGILRAPSVYSPWQHPELADTRRKIVVDRMRACGYVDEKTAARLLAQPFRFRKKSAGRRPAPYFVTYVQSFLARLLPEGAGGVYRAGLRVETTIDPAMQQAAEAAIARLDAKGADGPEGCLVALDPQTGAVRAMVGGRDFNRSQFNRATQARRQPGSAFKPIVYASALEQGYTLTTLKSCQPQQFRLGTEAYTPTDAGSPYHQSELNLRDALAASCNVVAVALGAELGPAAVAELGHRLGIKSTLRPFLSLPLGTSEVSPLEMAGVYAAFANGGLHVEPFGVASVRTSDGRLLYRAPQSAARAIKPSTAFLITQALTGVFSANGTAPGLNPGRPAAGKTGTSDGNRDAWFAGYTPDLVAVVQVGYDRGQRALPGSGGSLAAPIWADFIHRALHSLPSRDFTMPEDVHSLLVCRDTGAIAGPACPARTEYFARGTEPRVSCERHRLVPILVCRRSRLLPGTHCRQLEMIEVRPGEEPTGICDLCRGSIFEFLENLFGRRRPKAVAPKQPPDNTRRHPKRSQSLPGPDREKIDLP